jgi:hypothetical protein
MSIQLQAGYALVTIGSAVGLIVPPLVLAGGFQLVVGQGVVPIPNGIMHSDGGFAAVAVMTLRQYAGLSEDPGVSTTMNTAAGQMERSLRSQIDPFLQELERRVAPLLR